MPESEFQYPLFPFQIISIQMGRRNGTRLYVIPFLAGIVIVHHLLCRQLLFFQQTAFQLYEIIHARAVGILHKDNSPGTYTDLSASTDNRTSAIADK